MSTANLLGFILGIPLGFVLTIKVGLEGMPVLEAVAIVLAAAAAYGFIVAPALAHLFGEEFNQ